MLIIVKPCSPVVLSSDTLICKLVAVVKAIDSKIVKITVNFIMSVLNCSLR